MRRLQIDDRQHGMEALEARVTIEVAIPRKIAHAQAKPQLKDLADALGKRSSE